MATPARGTAVRVAAGAVAVVLALAVPVLLVLAGAVDARWRPLIGTLLVVSILVPIVVWFRGTGVAHDPSADDEVPPPRS